MHIINNLMGTLAVCVCVCVCVCVNSVFQFRGDKGTTESHTRLGM